MFRTEEFEGKNLFLAFTFSIKLLLFHLQRF